MFAEGARKKFGVMRRVSMIAEILLGSVTPIGSLAKERAAYNGVDRTIKLSREHSEQL